MRSLKKLYNPKNFGIQSEEVINDIGANAKLNEFEAATSICNLRHMDSEISKRKIVSERYRKNLEKVNGIVLLPRQKEVIKNYAFFPKEDILGKTRNDIYEQSK